MKRTFVKIIALVLATVSLFSVLSACNAHTHEWGEWQTESVGNCCTKGTEIRVCKTDSTHTEVRETTFGDHDWADWQTIEQADCNKEGKEKRVCKLDGAHVEERTIASGHVGAGDWLTDETGHWKKCAKCSEKCDFSKHKSSNPATTFREELCDTCGYVMSEKVNLNNKKILFVGNSYTYYGNCVRMRNSETYSGRVGDKSNFYKLCKDSGYNVTVTNWTMDGHNLYDIIGDVCTAKNKDCYGTNHYEKLVKDCGGLNYDYVVLQSGSGKAEWGSNSFIEKIHEYMQDFKDANSKVKFVLLLPTAVHNNEYAWKPAIKTLAEEGMIIADWGKMVTDIINGYTTVPGATMTYNKNSFIVAKSTSDGYHPNILSGYITALMTYCSITGESAVGKGYEFCHEETNTGVQFNYEKFIETYYKVGTTNFDKIMRSANEMNGIQQLVDRYIAQKDYLNY